MKKVAILMLALIPLLSHAQSANDKKNAETCFKKWVISMTSLHYDVAIKYSVPSTEEMIKEIKKEVLDSEIDAEDIEELKKTKVDILSEKTEIKGDTAYIYYTVRTIKGDIAKTHNESIRMLRSGDLWLVDAEGTARDSDDHDIIEESQNHDGYGSPGESAMGAHDELVEDTLFDSENYIDEYENSTPAENVYVAKKPQLPVPDESKPNPSENIRYISAPTFSSKLSQEAAAAKALGTHEADKFRVAGVAGLWLENYYQAAFLRARQFASEDTKAFLLTEIAKWNNDPDADSKRKILESVEVLIFIDNVELKDNQHAAVPYQIIFPAKLNRPYESGTLHLISADNPLGWGVQYTQKDANTVKKFGVNK